MFLKGLRELPLLHHHILLMTGLAHLELVLLELKRGKEIDWNLHIDYISKLELYPQVNKEMKNLLKSIFTSSDPKCSGNTYYLLLLFTNHSLKRVVPNILKYWPVIATIYPTTPHPCLELVVLNALKRRCFVSSWFLWNLLHRNDDSTALVFAKQLAAHITSLSSFEVFSSDFSANVFIFMSIKRIAALDGNLTSYLAKFSNFHKLELLSFDDSLVSVIRCMNLLNHSYKGLYQLKSTYIKLFKHLNRDCLKNDIIFFQIIEHNIGVIWIEDESKKPFPLFFNLKNIVKAEVQDCKIFITFKENMFDTFVSNKGRADLDITLSTFSLFFNYKVIPSFDIELEFDLMNENDMNILVDHILSFKEKRIGMATKFKCLVVADVPATQEVLTDTIYADTLSENQSLEFHSLTPLTRVERILEIEDSLKFKAATFAREKTPNSVIFSDLTPGPDEKCTQVQISSSPYVSLNAASSDGIRFQKNDRTSTSLKFNIVAPERRLTGLRTYGSLEKSQKTVWDLSSESVSPITLRYSEVPNTPSLTKSAVLRKPENLHELEENKENKIRISRRVELQSNEGHDSASHVSSLLKDKRIFTPTAESLGEKGNQPEHNYRDLDKLENLKKSSKLTDQQTKSRVELPICRESDSIANVPSLLKVKKLIKPSNRSLRISGSQPIYGPNDLDNLKKLKRILKRAQKEGKVEADRSTIYNDNASLSSSGNIIYNLLLNSILLSSFKSKPIVNEKAKAETKTEKKKRVYKRVPSSVADLEGKSLEKVQPEIVRKKRIYKKRIPLSDAEFEEKSLTQPELVKKKRALRSKTQPSQGHDNKPLQKAQSETVRKKRIYRKRIQLTDAENEDESLTKIQKSNASTQISFTDQSQHVFKKRRRNKMVIETQEGDSSINTIFDECNTSKSNLSVSDFSLLQNLTLHEDGDTTIDEMSTALIYDTMESSIIKSSNILARKMVTRMKELESTMALKQQEIEADIVKRYVALQDQMRTSFTEINNQHKVMIQELQELYSSKVDQLFRS